MQYENDIFVEEFIYDDWSDNFDASRRFVTDNVDDANRREYLLNLIDLKNRLMCQPQDAVDFCKQILQGKMVWETVPFGDYFMLAASVEGARLERQWMEEDEEGFKKAREESWRKIQAAMDERSERVRANTPSAPLPPLSREGN